MFVQHQKSFLHAVAHLFSLGPFPWFKRTAPLLAPPLRSTGSVLEVCQSCLHKDIYLPFISAANHVRTKLLARYRLRQQHNRLDANSKVYLKRRIFYFPRFKSFGSGLETSITIILSSLLYPLYMV